MNILHNALFLAGSALVVGTIIGYWLVRWKERNVRTALAIKEQSILDAAAREAETLAREDRVKCNEESARVKQETERSFSTRQTQLLETERRLTERETLVNRQLESFVAEEKALRTQPAEWQKKSEALDAQRCELTQAMKQRRDEIQTLARMSEADARAL